MPERLIITNGDIAADLLRGAGVDGDVVIWRDMLHDGPVPGGLALEALSLIRAQFLAKEFARPMPPIVRQFATRDAAMRNHGQYERIELWFEQDLYDQLQLIQVLDFFVSEKRSEGFFLVEVADSFGTMSTEAVQAAAEMLEPVGRHTLQAGRRGWAAFTAQTPEPLAALEAELRTAEAAALPHLGAALARLLQELPAVTSGLSLTEERVLHALAPGSRTIAELFAAIQTQESARFLGDTAFYRRIDGLAFSRQPLISGLEALSTQLTGDAAGPDHKAFAGKRLRIMENGRLALAGRFDHAVENLIDRWIGGTHITGKAIWRRSPAGLLRPGEEPPKPASRFGAWRQAQTPAGAMAAPAKPATPPPPSPLPATPPAPSPLPTSPPTAPASPVRFTPTPTAPAPAPSATAARASAATSPSSVTPARPAPSGTAPAPSAPNPFASRPSAPPSSTPAPSSRGLSSAATSSPARPTPVQPTPAAPTPAPGPRSSTTPAPARATPVSPSGASRPTAAPPVPSPTPVVRPNPPSSENT